MSVWKPRSFASPIQGIVPFRWAAIIRFERAASRGFRLNIPAGNAVRFEPGDEREVELVALAGQRVVYGFNDLVSGAL